MLLRTNCFAKTAPPFKLFKNLNQQTKKSRNRSMNTENKLMFARGKGGGGMGKMGYGEWEGTVFHLCNE